jgi:methionyl aminopeptidase
MIQRNDPCWCNSGKKWKKCHYPKTNPDLSNPDSTNKDSMSLDSTKVNSYLKQEYYKRYGILVKSTSEIEGIRKSCKLAAKILNKLCIAAQKGVTTNQLNDLSNKLHSEAKAIPAPLGYGEPPFPKSICTSLNDVICHGIPNDIPLKDGDIVNIDVTCILNGYYGDCSKMVPIGKISDKQKLVIDTSYECLIRAIKVCKNGVEIKEIGKAIEDYAKTKKTSVVNQFVGHGVGINFHENPQIPHNYNNIRTKMITGMTFTIEPMINAGKREAVLDENNHWEARTIDGKPSAQFEHTILITDDGAEILTLEN